MLQVVCLSQTEKGRGRPRKYPPARSLKELPPATYLGMLIVDSPHSLLIVRTQSLRYSLCQSLCTQNTAGVEVFTPPAMRSNNRDRWRCETVWVKSMMQPKPQIVARRTSLDVFVFRESPSHHIMKWSKQRRES